MYTDFGCLTDCKPNHYITTTLHKSAPWLTEETNVKKVCSNCNDSINKYLAFDDDNDSPTKGECTICEDRYRYNDFKCKNTKCNSGCDLSKSPIECTGQTPFILNKDLTLENGTTVVQNWCEEKDDWSYFFDSAQNMRKVYNCSEAINCNTTPENCKNIFYENIEVKHGPNPGIVDKLRFCLYDGCPVDKPYIDHKSTIRDNTNYKVPQCVSQCQTFINASICSDSCPVATLHKPESEPNKNDRKCYNCTVFVKVEKGMECALQCNETYNAVYDKFTIIAVDANDNEVKVNYTQCIDLTTQAEPENCTYIYESPTKVNTYECFSNCEQKDPVYKYYFVNQKDKKGRTLKNSKYCASQCDQKDYYVQYDTMGGKECIKKIDCNEDHYIYADPIEQVTYCLDKCILNDTYGSQVRSFFMTIAEDGKTAKKCEKRCSGEYKYINIELSQISQNNMTYECQSECQATRYINTTKISGMEQCYDQCETKMYQSFDNQKICVTSCPNIYKVHLKDPTNSASEILNYQCMDQCKKSDGTGEDGKLVENQCYDTCPEGRIYTIDTDNNCYANCPGVYANPYCPVLSDCNYRCDKSCLYYIDVKKVKQCLSAAGEITLQNGSKILKPCSSVSENDGTTTKVIHYFQTDVSQLDKSLYSDDQLQLIARQCFKQCSPSQFRYHNISASNDEIYNYHYCQICTEYVEIVNISNTNVIQCVNKCGSSETGKYKIIDGLKQCIKDGCNVFIQELTAQQCFSDCSSTPLGIYQYLIQSKGNQCVAQCPTDTPFITKTESHECVSQCQSNTFSQSVSAKQCEDQCSQYKVSVIINDKQMFQCVSKCPETLGFVDVATKQCGQRCQTGKYLQINENGLKECHIQCPKQDNSSYSYYYQYDLVNGVKQYQCMKNCESMREQGVYFKPVLMPPGNIQGNVECQKSCPTTGSFVYEQSNHVCVKYCPTGTFAQSQKCVDACSKEFPFFDIILATTPNAPVNYRCQIACPDGYIFDQLLQANLCQTCSKYVYDDKQQKRCVADCDVNQYLQEQQCVTYCDTRIANKKVCTDKCLNNYEIIMIGQIEQLSCLDSCNDTQYGNLVQFSQGKKQCIKRCNNSQLINSYTDTWGQIIQFCVDSCMPFAYDPVTQKCSRDCYYYEQKTGELNQIVKICMPSFYSCITNDSQQWNKIAHLDGSVQCLEYCDWEDPDGFTYTENYTCKQTCENTLYYQIAQLKTENKVVNVIYCVSNPSTLYSAYDIYSATLRRAEVKCNTIRYTINDNYTFASGQSCAMQCSFGYKIYYNKELNQKFCTTTCPNRMFHEKNNTCEDETDKCKPYVIENGNKKCVECDTTQGNNFVGETGYCFRAQQCTSDTYIKNVDSKTCVAISQTCASQYYNFDLKSCYNSEQDFLDNCFTKLYFQEGQNKYCTSSCNVNNKDYQYKYYKQNTQANYSGFMECCASCDTKYVSSNNVCIDECEQYINLLTTPPICQSYCPYQSSGTNYIRVILHKQNSQHYCLQKPEDCYNNTYLNKMYINKAYSYIDDNTKQENITYYCEDTCHIVDKSSKFCQDGCKNQVLSLLTDQLTCQTDCKTNADKPFQSGKTCSEKCPHSIYYSGEDGLLQKDFRNLTCISDISGCRGDTGVAGGYYYRYQDKTICMKDCNITEEERLNPNNITHVRLSSVECSIPETITSQCPFSIEAYNQSQCGLYGCNLCVTSCPQNYVVVSQTFNYNSGNRTISRCQTKSYCQYFNDKSDKPDKQDGFNDGFFVNGDRCVEKCPKQSDGFYAIDHSSAQCYTSSSQFKFFVAIYAADSSVLNAYPKYLRYITNKDLSKLTASDEEILPIIVIGVKSCSSFSSKAKFFIAVENKTNQYQCIEKCPDNMIQYNTNNLNDSSIQCIQKTDCQFIVYENTTNNVSECRYNCPAGYLLYSTQEKETNNTCVPTESCSGEFVQQDNFCVPAVEDSNSAMIFGIVGGVAAVIVILIIVVVIVMKNKKKQKRRKGKGRGKGASGKTDGVKYYAHALTAKADGKKPMDMRNAVIGANRAKAKAPVRAAAEMKESGSAAVRGQRPLRDSRASRASRIGGSSINKSSE